MSLGTLHNLLSIGFFGESLNDNLLVELSLEPSRSSENDDCFHFNHHTNDNTIDLG